MRLVTAVCVLMMVMPLPLRGQGPIESVDPVAVELAKLNSTLQEIADLLKKQGRADDLDLLMKRVQLAESQLGERERALRASESEQRSLESEKSQLELRLRMIAAQVEDMGSDMPLGQVEVMMAQGETGLKRVKQRLADVANEIATLQNDLTLRRDEAQAWKSALDRRLSGH